MHKTIISVSGWLQSEHLDALKVEVDSERFPVALDLEDLTFVDIDVIRFLNAAKKLTLKFSIAGYGNTRPPPTCRGCRLSMENVRHSYEQTPVRGKNVLRIAE